MGFNSYDSIINALTVNNKGQRLRFNKASITTVANYWSRLWATAGYPAAGSDPTGLAGAIPTKDTVGAIKQTNPTGPATLHLLQWSKFGTIANGILIYDRLWHAGGINLNSGSLQNITFNDPLTRYSDGVEVGIAVEITVAAGATAKTMSISYTNTSDQSGRTASVDIDGSAPVNRVYFANLQSGDKEVKSIESITMSGTMGAGTANIILYMQLDESRILANDTVIKDLITQYPSLPQIIDNACLSFYILASTTTSGIIQGKLLLCEN